MQSHWYALQTTARDIVLLDESFSDKVVLKDDLVNLSQAYSSITDFALSVKLVDNNPNQTATFNGDCQLAIVFDETQVFGFECITSSGDTKKKLEFKIDKEDELERREIFLGFIKPDNLYVANLYEEHQTDSADEDDAEKRISIQKIVLALNLKDKKQKLQETHEELEFDKDEHILSIDQLKVHFVQSIDGNMQNLNVVIASPKTSSYEILNADGKKLVTNDGEFEDNKTIE